MENPKVAEEMKAAVRDAASQGGTCREGTSESPQRGCDDPPNWFGTRKESSGD